MLPPPPTSRKSSYAYSLPHRSATRLPSFAPSHLSHRSIDHSFNEQDDEERQVQGDGTMSRGSSDEDASFEDRLGMEEDLEGMTEDRGLEETLEKLGFGAYQWRLLALCGCGWMSDNSALSCIAVILPRVQIHFDLSSRIVGLLSASTMAGMMIGAVGWGSVSDMLGRALPFNSTLFLTAVFGIGASFAPSFSVLCVWMFFLGSAVGGSMPTDGTLFLENLPHSKQYLLTFLSVFFSLGAVLSSTVSFIFLPGASCRQFEGCDIDAKENDGWRRVLLVLGLFNLLCAFARWSFLRLHESPRYLVSNGREQEAVVVLRAIATYNDQPMDIHRADVQGGEELPAASGHDEGERDKKSSELPSPELDPQLDERAHLPRYSVSEEGSRPPSRTRYDAVGMGQSVPVPHRQLPLRTGSAFYAETPGVMEPSNEFDASFGIATGGDNIDGDGDGDGGEGADRARLMNGDNAMDGELPITRGGVKGRKRYAAGPLLWWHSWVKQLKKLFVPKWRRTVILMWIIWGTMSFAYTMFNVWLPAVLESRASGEGDDAIREALQEFVLYSVAGCPGSIVGAWMIQTRLGRRKSLAICTTATALSTFAFIKVSVNWAVIVSSMTISAAATAMYAVLYGMTPETFGTTIRGTACGTSAALSRLTGVLAPVSAGVLLTIYPSLPVFSSAAIFLVTAGCSLALPFERVAEGRRKGVASLAH